MRVVTFKADEELLEKLDSIARIKGISRSEAIREAIKEFIEKEENRFLESILFKRTIISS